MEYYRNRGVEAIQGGMLSLRRRSPTMWMRNRENWIRFENWVRLEDLPKNPGSPFGQSVLETFATEDELAKNPTDEKLLELKPALADDVRMENEFAVEDGKWALTSCRIVRTEGVQASLKIDPAVAEFLATCQGPLDFTGTGSEAGRPTEDRSGAGSRRSAAPPCASWRSTACWRFPRRAAWMGRWYGVLQYHPR